ncbi:hypothetical protein [Actinomadura violacea]|uniref:Uncharacterized protein n=1 Tax=Actinomadura violacea TaxID=2819934 RepID=A0ABS3RGW6_9ACTN|nr:hypothetical protein [Actinomadura violacea]MBO2455969.1 hypothetical protein [Actinomadura violacea]
MREYLIQARTGDGWIAFHHDDLAQVLTPAGWECAPVDGWGDHRLRLGEVEIAFSGEPPGWQISFEGEFDSHIADAVIATVTHQLGEHSGREAAWFLINK